MDTDRLLLSMISKSLLLGTDPVLADILTDENIMHSQFAKNALRFISDIDFDDPTSHAKDQVISMRTCPVMRRTKRFTGC